MLGRARGNAPFKAAIVLDKRIAVPLGAVLRHRLAPLIQGSLAIVVSTRCSISRPSTCWATA